jgi:hypothetical protein
VLQKVKERGAGGRRGRRGAYNDSLWRVRIHVLRGETSTRLMHSEPVWRTTRKADAARVSRDGIEWICGTRMYSTASARAMRDGERGEPGAIGTRAARNAGEQ